MTPETDLLVGGFMPPAAFRNLWVPVLVCSECHGVAAVVHNTGPIDAKDADRPDRGSWTPLAGDDRGPCCVCGFYLLPTATFAPHEDKTVKTTIVRHLDRSVARYDYPFRWWNPWTWSTEGQWQLRRYPVAPAATHPTKTAGGPDLKVVPNPEPPAAS